MQFLEKIILTLTCILKLATLQHNEVPVETFFYACGEHGYGMNNPTWMYRELIIAFNKFYNLNKNEAQS